MTMHEHVTVPAPRRTPWNKGQADRRETAAPAKACLGHPDKITSRGPKTRFGSVQSGHRQQAARLWPSQHQGWGHCPAGLQLLARAM